MASVPSEVDHEDKDNRNNKPSNLRPASHAQNLYNTRAHSDNTSGFKGVSWDGRYRHWEARIRSGGRSYHLGYFKDPKIAHAAYTEAANQLNGEFARAA